MSFPVSYGFSYSFPIPNQQAAQAQSARTPRLGKSREDTQAAFQHTHWRGLAMWWRAPSGDDWKS